MEEDISPRGYRIVRWLDRYDNKCLLNESSLATEPCIWLGMAGGGMHLTQQMVADLLPYLQRFVDTGKLAAEQSR
jgi:hypothetical protein